MWNLLVFIVVLSVYQAYCAKIKFNPSIEHGNLNLDCTYNLTKDEVLYKVLLKKDSETFVKFDEGNKDKPEFHKVPGISDVTLNGGGKVTINKFGDDTWGIYTCIVLYDTKNAKNKNNPKKKVDKGTQNVSKKYKLRLDACTPKWVPASGGNIPPKTAMLKSTANGWKLAFCRVKFNGSLTAGFISTQGCVVTFDQKYDIEKNNYEVLTGDGFIWEKHSGGNQNVPEEALQCGEYGDSKMYCGACRVKGVWHLGKIGPKLYYYYEKKEMSDCTDQEILVCAQ